jgi:hypothetical protein
MNNAGYQILNNRAFGILGQDAHIRVNLLALRDRRQKMIWAVYTAPQKALEIQWKLQLRDAEQKRRLDVFRVLMATRGNVLH